MTYLIGSFTLTNKGSVRPYPRGHRPRALGPLGPHDHEPASRKDASHAGKLEGTVNRVDVYRASRLRYQWNVAGTTAYATPTASTCRTTSPIAVGRKRRNRAASPSNTP